MGRFIEMEAFATVVEQGGFTIAARKMGMSKSAVSKHVANLEQRLGTRLLDRSTRKVHPTEIGLAYYDRAARILNDAGEADALVTAISNAPTGTLRVSVATDFGVNHLSPVIGTFLHEHPGLSVNLVLQNRFAELISEGFDMGIRIGEMEDSSLRARKFAEAEKRLIASPGYLDRYGRPDSIQDLKKHKLLHYSNRPSGHVWNLTAANGAKHQIRATGWLSVNDGQSLLNAAVAGLGIAHLPSFLYETALRSGHAVEVLPDLRPEKLGIYAVYPNGRFIQPKVRAFIDFLLRTFPASDSEH